MKSFSEQLRKCGFAIGVTSYADHWPGDDKNTDPRIVLSIRVGNAEETLTAVVDTAATWCVIDPEWIASMGIDKTTESLGELKYNTRWGQYSGKLYRVLISLVAEEGEDLGVETWVFVPDSTWLEWSGYNFIGLSYLNSIRFAVHPNEYAFYFGEQ